MTKLIAISLVLLTVTACAQQRSPLGWTEGDHTRFNGMVGKPPPPLAVENWMNSQPLKLESLKGKVVLLDFWATWCGPCIESIPHTNELMEKYKDQGLVIIGVCHSDGAENMQTVASEHRIKYPIAADVKGATMDAYKVDSYPDTYFIDRAGNLRIPDCTSDKIEDAIKTLLAEK